MPVNDELKAFFLIPHNIILYYLIILHYIPTRIDVSEHGEIRLTKLGSDSLSRTSLVLCCRLGVERTQDDIDCV